MIIRELRTHLLSVPYPEPPRFAEREATHQDLLVLEIEVDSGLVGMGYLQPLAGGLQTLASCIHELLEPLLLGEDARAVETLWQRMWQASYIQGRMGLSVMALSAVDIALWDLAGKATDLPLYRLWGGSNRELPIYGSGCYRGLGGEGMIEKARRYQAAGFDAIKMQVAHLHTPAQDIRNVRAMREALGADTAIMVDVNQGWSADQAVQIGARLEEFDPHWLEEPVAAGDFAGYRRVAAALRVPIVGGENHFTRFDLRPFFEHPCVFTLQPDVMRGGLTEIRRIAAVADTWGIRIAPHLFHELMTHVVAAIPNPSWLEYMGWHDELWVEPVLPEQGHVRAPERPGHGLAFKPELLREFRLRARR
ncbi:MAG: mandelate racemase/muconate lactonizing enzyme family protein [Pseudomonadales bacterium]